MVDPLKVVLFLFGDCSADRAKELFDEMLYEDALVAMTKAINLKPNVVDFYRLRGEAALMMCDFQSAILNYKKTCVLEPDTHSNYNRLAFIYYMHGQCLFDQKLYPEALESFSRAAEMRPDVIGYHMRRCNIYKVSESQKKTMCFYF